MGNAEDLQTAKLQFQRLRRHYEISLDSNDKIALLDLSNTLRIWVQMKQSLLRVAPKLATSIAFKSASPSRQLMRVASGVEHILCYMPGSTKTRAATDALANGPSVAGDFQLAIGFMRDSEGFSHFRRFAFIHSTDGNGPTAGLDQEDVSRLNFPNWLGAEAAKVGLKNADGKLIRYSLTREIIINRVANTLDGSHSSIDNESDNRFDPAVRRLLEYSAGGITLPYFILMKIAQDMLEIIPRLIGIIEPSSSDTPA